MASPSNLVGRCTKSGRSPRRVVALLGVLLWLVSVPIFGFSDKSTTIITFLVVFLIQNTQNHDSRAMHLKIDELLRAVKRARTDMVALEILPDKELDRLEREFEELRVRRRRGRSRHAHRNPTVRR